MAKPRPTTPYEQFLLLKKKRQTQKEILPNENTNQQHQQQQQKQQQQKQQKSRTPAFNICKSYRYECASEPLGPGSKVLETFEANVIRNKDGSFTFLNQQQQQQQQQKQKQKQQLQQQQKQEDVLIHMMRRPQRDEGEGEGEVPPHMNMVTKIAQRLMAVERELDATKKELNAVKKALKIVNVDRNRNRNGNGINKKNTEIESDDVLSDHDDDDIDSDDAWSDSNDLKEGFENSGVFSFDSNCDEMDSSEDEHQIWKGDDQAYKCHRRRDGGDNGGDVDNDGDGDGDGGNSGDANINSRTSTCTKGIKKREGKGIMAPTRKSRRHQNPTDRYQNTTKSAERLKEGRSVSVNVTIARHSYHMDADAGADSDSNSANRSSSTCSSHHQPLSAIIHSRYNEWDTDESDHPEDFCGQH